MHRSKKRNITKGNPKRSKTKDLINNTIPTHGKNKDQNDQSSLLKEVVQEKILSEDLKIDLFSEIKADGRIEELHTIVEELAEDMIDLFKKLGEITERITATESSVAKVQNAVEQSSNAVNRELDQIKDKLLSDRKEITSRATFNALMPALESLQYMKNRYEKNGEESLQQNVNSMIGILNGILQSLRYSSYEVKEGDLFDPNTMECYGYTQGEEGKVIRVERSGYRYGSVLVRPCAVIIGKPVREAE